jgi:hypothetical protein
MQSINPSSLACRTNLLSFKVFYKRIRQITIVLLSFIHNLLIVQTYRRVIVIDSVSHHVLKFYLHNCATINDITKVINIRFLNKRISLFVQKTEIITF